MAFIRENFKKGISLPGLIDIVFLLLIFSLVTLQFSNARSNEAPKGNKTDEQFTLPRVESREAQEVTERVTRLMFHIEHQVPGDNSSPLVVYALFPQTGMEMTIAESKAMIDTSLSQNYKAVYDANYLDLSPSAFKRHRASVMIEQALADYYDEHFFDENVLEYIEIRATRETGFRIINHIMDCVAKYDDALPRLLFRTISGSEVQRGT